LVRAYLGFERLDTVNQTLAVNYLYDKMWLYYNFFQPVLHLTEKLFVHEEGQPTRVKRRMTWLALPSTVSAPPQPSLKNARHTSKPCEPAPIPVNCETRSKT
jgi:hypothetical protein